jgi:twitching motility protein PilU
MFPEERRPQLLMGLSQNLRAFVSQRLLPTVDGKRCAAIEILLGTKTIQELILKGRFTEIKEIMEKSENLGMQTFDGALFKLYVAGKISFDDAIANADSPNNLRLRIKLAGDSHVAPSVEVVKAATKATSFSELSLEKLDDDAENS